MSDSDTSDSGREGCSTGAIKKKKYDQHYKENWEELPDFKGWIMKSRKGKDYAKCKPCDKDINITSGKDALTKHAIGKFHLQKVKSVSTQRTLESFARRGLPSQIQLENEVKEGELSTFMY